MKTRTHRTPGGGIARSFLSLISWSIPWILLGCATGSPPGTKRAEAPDRAVPATEAPPGSGASDGMQAEQEEAKEEGPETEASRADEEPHAGSPAPPDSAPEKKKSARSLLSEQSERRVQLEESLDPNQLSCSGAKPIVEAICLIAERVCKLKDDQSSLKRNDCRTAQNSCDAAQKKYNQACNH